MLPLAENGVIANGTIVAGRYRILRCLSAETSGQNYLCRHLEISDALLVMCVITGDKKDPAARSEHVLRNATAAFRVSHRNIANIYDFVREEGIVAFTREFVPGATLAEYIAHVRRPSAETIARILFQVACALEALHNEKAVHGALDADKIVVTNRGEVKLIGFRDGPSSSEPTAVQALGRIGISLAMGDCSLLEEETELPGVGWHLGCGCHEALALLINRLGKPEGGCQRATEVLDALVAFMPELKGFRSDTRGCVPLIKLPPELHSQSIDGEALEPSSHQVEIPLQQNVSPTFERMPLKKNSGRDQAPVRGPRPRTSGSHGALIPLLGMMCGICLIVLFKHSEQEVPQAGAKARASREQATTPTPATATLTLEALARSLDIDTEAIERRTHTRANAPIDLTRARYDGRESVGPERDDVSFTRGDTHREMQLKATLLYRFADYIAWPSGTFATANTPVTVCLIGSDAMARYLETTLPRAHTLEGRPYSLVRLPSEGREQITRCNILYLSTVVYPAVAQDLSDYPVVTVSDGTGVGIVDLYLRDNHVKFRISRARATRAQLSFGAILLDLAAAG